ncbi:hypothetical protein OSTOST_11417, partial [Ostertagia ostertagi]
MSPGVGAGAADVAQGIGARAGADGIGQRVDAERARDRTVDAERDRGAAGGRGDAEKIEVGLEQGLCRRQHDRQLGRDAARDHALISDGLGRDVTEHRRHHAERVGPAGDTGDHGVEPLLRRRDEREAVRKFGLRQDLLRAFPGRRFFDDRPAAPLVHERTLIARCACTTREEHLLIAALRCTPWRGQGARLECRANGRFDQGTGNTRLFRGPHAASVDAQHRLAGDLPGPDAEQQHADVRFLGAGGADHRFARHAHVGQPAGHHAAPRRHAVGVPGVAADDAPRPQVRFPKRFADGHGRVVAGGDRSGPRQLSGDVPGRPVPGLWHRQHAALPLCRGRARARQLPRAGDFLRHGRRRAGGDHRSDLGAVHAGSLVAALPGELRLGHLHPRPRLHRAGLHRIPAGEVGGGGRPAAAAVRDRDPAGLHGGLRRGDDRLRRDVLRDGGIAAGHRA